MLPDGTVPKGIEAQTEACLRNIIAILADAGMGIGDLVKITTLLDAPDFPDSPGPNCPLVIKRRPRNGKGLRAACASGECKTAGTASRNYRF